MEPISGSTRSGSPVHSSFGGRIFRPSLGLSGPKFFPSSFVDSSPHKRSKRVRSKHVTSSPSPAQLLHRQVKKRLGLWKKMLEVLRCHKHVPEAEEALLLDIADQEGVKDNEEGLEGWTAYQLLHKASEGATTGFEILTQAVEDIVSTLSSRGHHKFRIRCSNITQWHTETQRWLQAQDDDVILQKTHLRRGALQDAVAAMHKVGFEMVGGEAFSTARHGTKGGVAVLTKTHIQSRVMQHFTVEGCGFCAVEIRVRGVSLLLLSLYLQNSTPLHCHPNAEIVARLVAVIKHHSGQWLIAGDFNLSPQEVADTALVNELGGQLHTVGFPTTHGGSELDFAITSSAIAGLISVALDWSAPHRPHASLCIEFLRLLDFPVNEAVAEPCLAASKPGPIPIKIVNLDFSEDHLAET